jgi:hypothetical protein
MGTVRFLADGTTPTISVPETANPEERPDALIGSRFLLERHSSPRAPTACSFPGDGLLFVSRLGCSLQAGGKIRLFPKPVNPEFEHFL